MAWAIFISIGEKELIKDVKILEKQNNKTVT